jgi:uncharacterized sporulation protein YeaH/YhbH (DUF444 family)
MTFTYDEIKGKTVAELREIASGIEDDTVKGYSQLNKERLLAALCKALNIYTHTGRKATGVEKIGIKESIRAAKKQRDEAVKTRDRAAQRAAQREIHDLKRQIRRLAKAKPRKKPESGK